MQATLLWIARILFLVLLIVMTALAFAAPQDPALDWIAFLEWDKAKHFVAYLTLTLVGLVAFPRIPLIVLALFLLGQSAIIEAAQPYFGRSRDLADLLANATGILSVFACLAGASIRSWLVRPREGDLIVPAEIVTRSFMDRR